MRKTRVALLWTLLVLVAVGSRAEVVADLHSATVPVANQSSEALAAAAREALAEVLVKGVGFQGFAAEAGHCGCPGRCPQPCAAVWL